MSTELDEKVWNAWLLKNKLREKAAARKAKVFGGILPIGIALGTGPYRFAVK